MVVSNRILVKKVEAGAEKKRGIKIFYSILGCILTLLGFLIFWNMVSGLITYINRIILFLNTGDIFFGVIGSIGIYVCLMGIVLGACYFVVGLYFHFTRGVVLKKR